MTLMSGGGWLAGGAAAPTLALAWVAFEISRPESLVQWSETLPHNTHETSFLGDSDDRTLGTTAVWNGLARCSGSDDRLHRLRCCDLTVKSTELELTS